jgi:hypothetical protein
VITPCPITIVLFTSVMSLNNIIGLPRRWTMDFVSRLLSKISKPVEFSVGEQNSSARASSFSTDSFVVTEGFNAIRNAAPGEFDAMSDDELERALIEPLDAAKTQAERTYRTSNCSLIN